MESVATQNVHNYTLEIVMHEGISIYVDGYSENGFNNLQYFHN